MSPALQNSGSVSKSQILETNIPENLKENQSKYKGLFLLSITILIRLNRSTS